MFYIQFWFIYKELVKNNYGALGFSKVSAILKKIKALALILLKNQKSFKVTKSKKGNK